MVYVDDAGVRYRGKLRYHLLADSVAELHAFAARLGVARCWYERSRRGVPHYDVTADQRRAALAAGAVAFGSLSAATKLALLRAAP